MRPDQGRSRLRTGRRNPTGTERGPRQKDLGNNEKET